MQRTPAESVGSSELPSGVRRTRLNDVGVTGATVDLYQAKVVLRSLTDVLGDSLGYALCLKDRHLIEESGR